jgi:AcrR family transcriptional regulator
MEVQMENRSHSNLKDKQNHYHHGNLKEALITAGLELLATGGPMALDLRKVAKKAGVSHTAPYRHFADKQSLLVAILETGFRRLADRLQHSLSLPSEQCFERLLQFVKAYVAFGLENPLLLRQMYTGVIQDKENYPELYTIYKAAFFMPLVNIVKEGQNNRELTNDDPFRLAVSIWSMMHGLTILLIEDTILPARPVSQNGAGVDLVIRNCLQTIYNGIKAHTETVHLTRQ